MGSGPITTPLADTKNGDRRHVCFYVFFNLSHYQNFGHVQGIDFSNRQL